jgi:histidinol dehydrogenase
MNIIGSREIKNDFFAYKESENLTAVKTVLRAVKEQGDEAVKRYTHAFDGVKLDALAVKRDEIERAYEATERRIIAALTAAAETIRRFAERQISQLTDFETEIVPGVFTGQRVVPIENVGVYVPGGRYPLVSTLLMCALPAKAAGVKKIVVCSPPSHTGSIHPQILTAARIAEIDELYSIGGIQAIAAMAYGTETVPRVDTIVGPGNNYVTAAKREVFGTVGIEFLAGPTELVIIADDTADPAVVAADLAAQAEHDEDAVPLLLTSSIECAQRVNTLLERLAPQSAAKALEHNGAIILVESMDEAVRIANRKAPEHIELQVKNAETLSKQLKNYGSLFIGKNAAEILGDYSSGLNHTLPTNTCARYTGGLSVMDFVKLQTTLRVTDEGLKEIGTTAKVLAEVEGLMGHIRALDLRERS